ncbi:methyl-accepting chemotaxis protein [Phosphitispora sp. TUW77]|uniref:methyl-accepting chemotaxis protein n=1 Tax=Phosphitispora sp. TUW77 TaxID=3152361 RepID=UPI003AB40E02
MRLTIGKKILGGFIFIALILLMVSIFSKNSTANINQMYNEIIETNMPISDGIAHLGYYQVEQAAAIRGYISYKDKSYIDTYNDAKKNQTEIYEEIEKLLTDEKSKELLAKQKELTKQYDDIVQNTIKAVEAGDMVSAFNFGVKARPIFKDYKANTDTWGSLVDESNQALINEAIRYGGISSQLFLAIAGVALIISLLLGIFISRNISKPVELLAGVAGEVADGNLAVTFPELKSNDEIKDLNDSFTGMVKNLKDLLHKIDNSSKSVAGTSEQLSSNSAEAAKVTQQVAQTIEQVAKGSSSQAEGVTEIVQVMDQMAQSIQQVASGAGEQNLNVIKTTDMVNDMVSKIDAMADGMENVKQVSEQNGVLAENGGQSVEKTVKGMLKVKEAVFDTSQRIHELGEHSQKIGDIIQVIDDIAEQTNLLALNAAIEAARAGEHGKGFAVVADEVRKLAERSGKATKEIAQLITDIQRGTNVAVESMQVGTKEVEAGVGLAQDAGKSLSEIVIGVKSAGDNVHKIMGLINDILANSREVSKAVGNVAAITEENTAATEEMSASTEEITSSMQNVATISEENASAAEEVSASTEELTASIEEISGSSQELAQMARELKNMVSQFRL